MSPPVYTVTGIAERSPGSGVYVVSVDGAPVGVLAASAIGDLGIRAGDTIDLRAMDRLRDAIAEQAVFEKGVELLSVRARSARELQRRLLQKGAGKAHVDAAIRRLTALGYLNDAAYADAVVRSKMVEGGASQRRVQQDLFKRGVPRAIADAAIAQAVDEHGSNEIEAALQLARKRMRSLQSLDQATRRRRLYGFLARRGYDSSAIGAVMKALGPDFAGQEFPGLDSDMDDGLESRERDDS